MHFGNPDLVLQKYDHELDLSILLKIVPKRLEKPLGLWYNTDRKNKEEMIA
ncbi:MAG: hypothetical protein K6F27_10510 [Ruminococcus sp.]|nr:hypothetical protein [Ruminococcus sp.]